MTHTALTFSTYVLEGVINMKTERDGIVIKEFEGKTFSGLFEA